MNSITPEGERKLKQELDELAKRREGVIERLKYARELGDLSESAEYTEARDTQTSIDLRVQEIEHILRTSTVSDGPKNSDIVEVGNKVEVKFDGKKVVYSIVGSVEADPSAGEISNQSPVGAALLGKSVGDEVVVKLPVGEKTFEILAIL